MNQTKIALYNELYKVLVVDQDGTVSFKKTNVGDQWQRDLEFFNQEQLQLLPVMIDDVLTYSFFDKDTIMYIVCSPILEEHELTKWLITYPNALSACREVYNENQNVLETVKHAYFETLQGIFEHLWEVIETIEVSISERVYSDT